MVVFVLTVTLWIKSNCYWFVLGHLTSDYKTVLLDIIGQSRSNNISNEEGKSGTFSSHYKVYISRVKKLSKLNDQTWQNEMRNVLTYQLGKGDILSDNINKIILTAFVYFLYLWCVLKFYNFYVWITTSKIVCMRVYRDENRTGISLWKCKINN